MINLKASVVGVATLAVALVGVFVAFESYSNKVANELMNAVVSSEAASIQQGNLLASITKLQAFVQNSASLSGIAVFDTKMDPKFNLPLILLGNLMNRRLNVERREVRGGLFEKEYLRNSGDAKVLVFHFNPRFVRNTFMICTFALILFLLLFMYYGKQLESVRASAQAEAFDYISKQISHDIKSPLGALKIFSSVMSQRGLDTEMLENVGRRIDDIIKDLEHRSAGENRSDSRFSVEKALYEIWREKKTEFPNTCLKLDTAAKFSVIGSVGQFKRVISNLLNNAIEASPANTEIKLGLRLEKGHPTVFISDSGVGITREVQTKLFRRGFSFNKANGRGLGLYHARRTIKNMKGNLELQSSPGIGTTVLIKFKT